MTDLFDLAGLEGALLRYRIMAYVVGVGLAVLVFVGMPLQFAAGLPQVVQIVGPLHGFLYIVYLLFALDLARRARFSLVEMLAMVGAGLVPILAFVIERRITKRVRTEVLPRWRLPRSKRSRPQEGPGGPESEPGSEGSALPGDPAGGAPASAQSGSTQAPPSP